jgi:hypothetical protein
MSWVWVVSFSVLNATSEHGTFGNFSTKAECEIALREKRVQMLQQNKSIVGTCFVTQKKS